MKKLILTVVMCLIAATVVFAGDVKLREAKNGLMQGAAPDPMLTFKINDNNSHTDSLSAILWFSLSYNGSGTCFVRLMNDTTKASYPQIPVASGSYYSRVIHPNSKFINYSGCNSGTAPNNSVMELM